MSRRVEIQLSLPIVIPLLARLRTQAASLEERSVSMPAGERGQVGSSLLEVITLLELFHPDFENTGVIAITSYECPAVLRACSFLRLQLRKDALSGMSEDALLSLLDSVENRGEEREFVMAYTFLATLQEILIEKLPPLRQLDFPLWDAVSSWMRRLARKRDRLTVDSRPGAAECWEVVVLDDPVNLMSYVTMVFQGVFLFSKDDAERYMREVHEAKSSRVWSGSREKAESYARELRDWHLQAITRKNS